MEIVIQLEQSGRFLVWPIDETEDKNFCRKEGLETMLNNHSDYFKGIESKIKLIREPDLVWTVLYDEDMPPPLQHKFGELLGQNQDILDDWQEQV